MEMTDGGDKDPKEDSAEENADTLRTQMVGEAPGEDLGYDPNTIPVESIPDDDEEVEKDS